MALGTQTSWLLEVFKQRMENLLFKKGCNHPTAANQMVPKKSSPESLFHLAKLFTPLALRFPIMMVIGYWPLGRALDPVNSI